MFPQLLVGLALALRLTSAAAELPVAATRIERVRAGNVGNIVTFTKRKGPSLAARSLIQVVGPE